MPADLYSGRKTVACVFLVIILRFNLFVADFYFVMKLLACFIYLFVLYLL